MDLNNARDLALAALDLHGLQGWSIKFDRAKSRAGLCDYKTRTLSFSTAVTVANSQESFIETLLHEVAHALTPGHNHDRVWQRKCIEIGGTGRRTATKEVTPERPWTGVHDGCSITFPRHRRPSGQAGCPNCMRRHGHHSPKAIITWVRTETLTMQEA